MASVRRLPPLPLLLLLLALLLPQPSLCLIDIFCDSPYAHEIRYVDFYIVTRNESSANYTPGSVCSFYAVSSSQSTRYFVEALNVSAPTAVVTVASGDVVMATSDSTGEWPRLRRAMSTQMNSLRVTLRAEASQRTGAGARFRVRMFSDCPPWWTNVGDFCFGNAANGELPNSVASSLNFAEAQAACVSMRANLLEVPPNFAVGVRSLFNELPHTLTQDNWIGLTDYTDEGQFKYFWLSGRSFGEVDRVRCGSSIISSTNKKCKIDERCASFSVFFLNPSRFVRMDKCEGLRSYTCFMPLGGSVDIHEVPQYKAFSPGAWLWAVVITVLFAIGVSIGVVYGVLRLLNSAKR